MDWALARGAPAVRTGLEDNLRSSRDRLAGSNAELVRMAADRVTRHGRAVATPAQARPARPQALITGRITLIACIGCPTEAFKTPMICNPRFGKHGIGAGLMPMGGGRGLSGGAARGRRRG